MFRYNPPSLKKDQRTITIPLSPNDLFILRTNDGYISFMRRVSSYIYSFGAFSGYAHVIKNDDDDPPFTISIDKTRDLPENMRIRNPSSSPPSDKTRELPIDAQTRELFSSTLSTETRERMIAQMPTEIPLESKKLSRSNIFLSTSNYFWQ